jgi:DNA-binding HxlR family transcriptional regulator
MPEFTLDGHVFQSPVELALHAIGGKWKMPILWRLQQRSWRYNELHRDLKRVSHKMLTQQLRELEAAGLLTRTVHPVVPPHVDYAISALGRSALPAIEGLRAWGTRYRTARERQQRRPAQRIPNAP